MWETLCLFPLRWEHFLSCSCPVCEHPKFSCIDHLFYMSGTATDILWGMKLHLVTRRSSFRSTLWYSVVTQNTKPTLVSLTMNSLHIGVTPDQLLFGQRFLIDIKYDSDFWYFLAVITGCTCSLLGWESFLNNITVLNGNSSL